MVETQDRNKFRIYLAARLARQKELIGYREQLEAAGHYSTAQWLDADLAGPNGSEKEAEEAGRLPMLAVESFTDIVSSDVLVMFSEQPEEFSSLPWAARGGRHVEFGISVALSNITIVVGPHENTFHYIPSVIVVDTFDEALDRLETIR